MFARPPNMAAQSLAAGCSAPLPLERRATCTSSPGCLGSNDTACSTSSHSQSGLGRCQDHSLAARRPVHAHGFREQAVLDFTPVERQIPLYSCVEDVMTKGRIFTVRPDTTIDEGDRGFLQAELVRECSALEVLVKERITGMPVIDDSDAVVGVVSDFDLLSLDGISGKMRATGMFPDTNTEWSAFFEVQKLLIKNQGRLISDVMTPDPMVVRGNTDLEAAARLLLERRIRRMPVVDSQGRLIGIFSRGDVIRAALTQRKAASAAQSAA